MAMAIAFDGNALARPHRIVSINMCADQYLMVLADKEQIAGLSDYARDKTLSFYAARAQSYPVVKSTAEAIMPLQPDLILGSPSRRLQTRALLKRFGFRTLDVTVARNFDDIVKQTRLIAGAVGYPARGEALIASTRARLAKVRPLPSNPPPVAVYYQRQGYVTGTDTLMDEMMRRVGLQNLAGRLHDAQLAHVDLEAIVAARPNYIIFTNDQSHIRDWGAMLLSNPALAAIQGKPRRLYIPDTLTVCGGPSYPAAVERLSAELHNAH